MFYPYCRPSISYTLWHTVDFQLTFADWNILVQVGLLGNHITLQSGFWDVQHPPIQQALTGHQICQARAHTKWQQCFPDLSIGIIWCFCFVLFLIIIKSQER